MDEASDEPPPVVTINGEKVALGPIDRGLVSLVHVWLNDLTVARTSGSDAPLPYTTEALGGWYDRAIAGERQANFTIYERETLRAIGTTGWYGIDYRNGTAEFGILIGETQQHGKGYGTEATTLMLDYAFTALGLHSVMLTTASFNYAGIRAYEMAGFKEFGRRRECRWMGGKWWDTVYMECLASEFNCPVLSHIFAPDERH